MSESRYAVLREARLRLLAMAYGVGLLVAACAPSDPYSGIWVTGTGTRALVHYLPCSAADRITEVAVSRVGHEDSPLWRERSSGSAQTVLPLGEPAPGFTATPETTDFAPTDRLIVTIETTQRTAGGLEFGIAELHPGKAVWDRGVTSRQNPYGSISRADRGC